MSAGATMWRMCHGKQPYTEQAARERAAQLNRRRRKRGPMIEGYACSCCPWFHLGGRKHATKDLRRGGV